MKIDTHQHLLLPERFNYPWTEDFAPLKGRFGLEDYRKAAEGCDISGSLFMEVDVAPEQSGDEARYFCGQAEAADSGIIGVIASGRPEQEGFLHHLDTIAHPTLKGIRRVLHVVPDEVSQSSLFRQNVAALARRDLTFDLCVRTDQHALAGRLVDGCPETQFILDHCGNPDIAGGALAPWKKSLEALAQCQNLAVKISGIPANCPPGQASAETLRPWVETVIDVFGWERVVWGGDWPVCALNGTLRSWCEALDEILSNESPANREKLFSTNAQRIYRL
ncbi:MAG: amidohydrolase family protein [Oceanipulchritudo sp.]